MSTGRELREEEIKYHKIFGYVRNLDKMLWNGDFPLEEKRSQLEKE